jgi:hypothetical protein
MKTLLLSAALVGGLAAGASATTFGGTFTGSFNGTSVGWYNNNCLFDGGAGLAWGSPSSTCPNLAENAGQDDSTMQIIADSWGKDVQGTDQVLIGEISGFNNANTAARDFRTGMNLSFSVTSPTADGPFTEFMNVTIENTPNNPADNAFLLSFDDFGMDLPTTFGDVELTGFSLGVTGGGTLSTATGNFGDWSCWFQGGCTKLTWINPENHTSTLQIFAEVTAPAAVVPLPAAGWMLLAGLGGFAAVKRRKQAVAA